MKKKMFLAFYHAIQEAYHPETLNAIIDILRECGYEGYGYPNGECYDRNVKTVRQHEYGNFLMRYAQEVMFYRFTA